MGELILENIAEALGELHCKYKLFSQSVFKNTLEENNILEYLEDFSYLKDFYKIYSSHFEENLQNTLNRTEAINNDLPFIGEKAINDGKVDFIIYFEGSRQDKNKISITVLSHLWLTEDKSIINKFCGKNKWWTLTNYLNMKNRLNIDKSVLERSYISDAIRFDDNTINKNLIQEEINFLKPKLVVCIGRKAKDLVGMRFYNFPIQFHHVKFPKYHNDNEMYKELNKILQSI